MSSEPKQIPPTITDEQILWSLADAHVPSLMLAMVHLTGDLGIIRPAS